MQIRCEDLLIRNRRKEGYFEISRDIDLRIMGIWNDTSQNPEVLIKGHRHRGWLHNFFANHGCNRLSPHALIQSRPIGDTFRGGTEREGHVVLPALYWYLPSSRFSPMTRFATRVFLKAMVSRRRPRSSKKVLRSPTFPLLDRRFDRNNLLSHVS